MAGDNARAQSIAQDLDKRYPLDTQMQSLWLAAIRAPLALDRNDPREAVTDLQGVQPSAEFGIINFTLNPSCLYPTYIKGQAHLAFGQGTEAAAEFLKIRDHSGMVWKLFDRSAGTHRHSSRQCIAGQKEEGAEADAARVRALAGYRGFLELWK